MAYANAQKNGGLEDRLKMETMALESIDFAAERDDQKGNDYRQNAAQAPSVGYAGPIGIGIADDVDDEAVYGRKRHRHQSRGR